MELLGAFEKPWIRVTTVETEQLFAASWKRGTEVSPISNIRRVSDTARSFGPPRNADTTVSSPCIKQRRKCLMLAAMVGMPDRALGLVGKQRMDSSLPSSDTPVLAASLLDSIKRVNQPRVSR